MGNSGWDSKPQCCASKLTVLGLQERAKQTPSTENVLASGPLSAPSSPAKQQQQKKEETTPLGVPQVAVGALSLLLVAVFVFTSGFGPGGGSSPQPEVRTVPSDDLMTQAEVKAQ